MQHRRFVVTISVCAWGALALLPARTVLAGTDAKAHGAELFAANGCAHCHGANGVGGGIGPDLQLVRTRMDAKQITTQIHDGGKEMPAYADDLSSAEIDDLVTFLRAKRKFIKVAPRPATPATPSKPDDGPGL